MTSRMEPRHIFLIAGEASGDLLGAKLMAALKRMSPEELRFSGVGGASMEREGCRSLFPLSDVAVMGVTAVIPRLPTLLRRIRETVNAVVESAPDVLVILDSPEFTHTIARRVKRKRPDLPVINYVPPTVWAWRPGRARKMRRYVDHALANFPFEPEAHKRLGGPECTYVGHPAIERLDWIRSLDPQDLARELGLSGERPVLAVLPGSRANEVKRLIKPFSGAVRLLFERFGPLDVIIPTVSWLREPIEASVAEWPVKPHLVEGEEKKFQAFRLARAALTVSGTSTLELALSGTPAVVGYRIDPLAIPLALFVKVPSIVLANLVLGEKVYPEFVHVTCVPDKLADAVLPLLEGGPERERQIAGLAPMAERMALPNGTPSERAADIVLRYTGGGWAAQGERSVTGT